MRADRFRNLLSRDGPFVSVHYDNSHDTEDAVAQLELRWRAIRDQLEAQGVGAGVSDELQRAVLGNLPPAGQAGRALVADRTGVVLNEPLLRGPAVPLVRVSPLPYLIPVVEHGLLTPTYLVVGIDRAGADLTVHQGDHDRSTTVDGSGYPVHKASGAESAGYGDPQPRAEEAARQNVREVTHELTILCDEVNPDAVFLVGEVRARHDLLTALPARVRDRVVTLQDGARGSIDRTQLHADIDEHFQLRRNAAIDAAAQQFVAARDGETGLAVQGLTGVCAALRDGAVETLIVGELDDRTVVLGEHLSEVAPNADVLSELGAAPTTTVRADEALPLLAVSTASELIRTDERISPRDGVGAVLRYRRRPA
ncbi:Rv2629 family ribosome hibernation factor [Mycobacterium sp. NPDC003323]